MNKKADLWETWGEWSFFILFIFGIVLALSINNTFLTYFVTFLIGLMCGRVLYYRKLAKQLHKVPLYFIFTGFFLGYLIGLNYGNKILIIATFVLGCWLSFYAHDKGYLD